jgi:predicted nucleic acid-binding protein
LKVIDTNIAVDHLRGKPEAVALLEGLVRQGEVVVASEMVRLELLAGVRPSERDALEEFCSALGWVPVNEDVSRAAGELASKHRKSSQGIDVVDYVIAATALILKAELLTTNIKHYPMLKDLSPPYQS